MKFSRRYNQIIIDALLIGISIVTSYLIRFEWDISNPYFHQLIFMIPLVVIGRMVVNTLSGVYKQLWRYITYTDIIKVAESLILFSLILVTANLISRNFGMALKIPYSIISIELMYTILCLIGIRIGRKLTYEYNHLKKRTPNLKNKNALLIGAGEAGQQVLREIHQKPELAIKVLGFLDDDERKQNTIINKAPILGKVSQIEEIVNYNEVDLIIICIPSASPQQLRTITQTCSRLNIETKTLPGLAELIDSRIAIEQLRKIEITDLLKREPVKLDFQSLKYLQDSRVLVTGAGGSIGSELCRQIAKFKPKELILLGKGENSIYLINEELSYKYPHLQIYPVIADVKNKFRLEHIFKKYKPDVVFHAAAHKHVPLMEMQPSEAVMNNIIGTKNVAELSNHYHIHTMVLISTDKAVNPTNIMGATKRVSELIIQDFARQTISTKYVAVRFGNVLGSRGSVVLKFEKQIAKGGPVTVTHPEVTRYFMTIPEAAQLVLQAGSLGNGGEIFILDMGEPVKIVDLANDLIILSGKIPYKDIDIIFSGLRPGEKIYEELLTKEEGINTTSYNKIFVAPISQFDSNYLETQIEKLEKNALSNNDEEIRRILQEELGILKPLEVSQVKNEYLY